MSSEMSFSRRAAHGKRAKLFRQHQSKHWQEDKNFNLAVKDGWLYKDLVNEMVEVYDANEEYEHQFQKLKLERDNATYYCLITFFFFLILIFIILFWF